MAAIAQGTIKSAEQGAVVLLPANTNYEVRLACHEVCQPGQLVKGTIALKAIKIWTIPAGGAFIQPLFGEPRVVQGVVKSVDGNRITVQAGLRVSIELPPDESAFDLKNGALQPGVMVNITIAPGARFTIEA